MSDKPKHDLGALRAHLFETLQALRDKDAPMDIDRARVISQVAGTLIESARVEVDYMRVTRSSGTGFLGGEAQDTHASPALPAVPVNGIVGIRRHLIKDD